MYVDHDYHDFHDDSMDEATTLGDVCILNVDVSRYAFCSVLYENEEMVYWNSFGVLLLTVLVTQSESDANSQAQSPRPMDPTMRRYCGQRAPMKDRCCAGKNIRV